MAGGTATSTAPTNKDVMPRAIKFPLFAWPATVRLRSVVMPGHYAHCPFRKCHPEINWDYIRVFSRTNSLLLRKNSLFR
jgi:hypothetical protein